MTIYHRLKAGLKHWLNEVDEHSIHSPFFFDFYNRIIRGKSKSTAFDSIEKLRSGLEQNNTVLSIVDFGSGSSVLKSPRRTIADIARVSVTPQVWAEFYSRVAVNMEAERIVELGSCLGITSLYLSADQNARVFTFEGSPALANVALTNFEYFDKKNIQLIEGNIDQTLPDFLQDPAKINFLLMDANHTYTATMKYFNWIMRRLDETSIVVMDDIHGSEEMEKAWDELKKHQLVYGSIDLFRCGVLFFDPALNRQHYILSLN